MMLSTELYWVRNPTLDVSAGSCSSLRGVSPSRTEGVREMRSRRDPKVPAASRLEQGSGRRCYLSTQRQARLTKKRTPSTIKAKTTMPTIPIPPRAASTVFLLRSVPSPCDSQAKTGHEHRKHQRHRRSEQAPGVTQALPQGVIASFHIGFDTHRCGLATAVLPGTCDQRVPTATVRSFDSKRRSVSAVLTTLARKSSLLPNSFRLAITVLSIQSVGLSCEAVGRHGWVSIQLATVDPAEVRELIVEAWRQTAPKRLVAAYDSGHSS